MNSNFPSFLILPFFFSPTYILFFSPSISLVDLNDLHRTGRGYLGKLRSNFVGTEFQVFDNGVNPKDTDPDEAAYASKYLASLCIFLLF